MSLPITRLVAAAQARGLSQSVPILLSTDGGVAKQRVNIIVSYNEPVSTIAPLDLLWIHPTTNVTLRRFSRANSQTHTHTWVEATESNFWTPQIWDEPKPSDQPYQELNRNVGNPHFLETSDINAINIAGGDMVGPLGVRVAENIDVYADKEALPKVIVKKLTDAAQAVAASVYQQMASVRSQITALRTRVTANEAKLVQHAEELQDHETRITRLQESGPVDPSNPPLTFRHTQLVAALEWEIPHNLGVPAVQVQVYLSSGQWVLPDIMEPVDVNTFRVTFAEARAGTAVLVGLR